MTNWQSLACQLTTFEGSDRERSLPARASEHEVPASKALSP